MRVRPQTTRRPVAADARRRRTVAAALAGVALVAVTACSAGDVVSGGSSGGDQPSSADDTTAPKPTLKVNVAKGAQGVEVSKVVSVAATDGELSAVTLTSPEGDVKGTMSKDGATWTAGDRLEPGTNYTVTATATGESDQTVRTRSTFSTQDLTLDQQTYPSVAPLQGETVGVGMPVIVTFDVPVTDEASMERNMHVTSTPAQPGTWHWVSEYEAHWRPKNYWKAGTKVDVDIDANGVPAGNGIYGQEDRDVDFKIGDAHIYKINAQTDQMQVFDNGDLLRTIPITTGKPGFTTRSGVKIIMEKFASKRMNSETVGIGGSEAYDIDNVQWAMRLTNSGEFIHAAPWSVGSQGYANVSHGCTGMSTDNAAWLYNMTVRGDVTVTTGTDRAMEPDNGYGDWNVSWQDYKKGSALS